MWTTTMDAWSNPPYPCCRAHPTFLPRLDTMAAVGPALARGAAVGVTMLAINAAIGAQMTGILLLLQHINTGIHQEDGSSAQA